ncbi:MAG: hypothetical protein JWP95_74 [Actinotalea sp.]|nr:hypothetical protein [Actinotalea sp.]
MAPPAGQHGTGQHHPGLPADGARTTPLAQAALGAVGDGLSGARTGLAAAADADWVSVAADRYRAVLADVLADVTRLTSARWSAHGPVLRHTSAADATRDDVAAARRAAVWEFPFP